MEKSYRLTVWVAFCFFPGRAEKGLIRPNHAPVILQDSRYGWIGIYKFKCILHEPLVANSFVGEHL